MINAMIRILNEKDDQMMNKKSILVSDVPHQSLQMQSLVMNSRQPHRLQVQRADLLLPFWQIRRILLYNPSQQVVGLVLPLNHGVVHLSDLVKLREWHLQGLSLLKYFSEGVLCYFLVVVPKVPKIRVILIRKTLAGHTEVGLIAFGLVLLDADTLDVVPFVTFLAVDHQGVLVKHSVPTDAVGFGVLNYQLRVRVYQLLDSLQRLFLVLVQLLFLLSFLRVWTTVVMVVLVHCHGWGGQRALGFRRFPFLVLRDQNVVSEQGDVVVFVQLVRFASSFGSIFVGLFLDHPAFCQEQHFLVLLLLEQFLKVFDSSRLQFHVDHWNASQQMIGKSFPGHNLCILVGGQVRLLEEDGDFATLAFKVLKVNVSAISLFVCIVVPLNQTVNVT